MIRGMLRNLLTAMRPKQWSKNVFVFAALAFDGQLLHVRAFIHTLAGFVLLCLISSAVYLLNDLADLEADRKHPVKRMRPIASGALSRSTARAASVLIAIPTFLLSYWLGLGFGAIVSLYFAINLVYSLWLKHVPIIDVLLVAAGFLLRVGAGATLIAVQRFSPWLYVCTGLLALFIGLGKRRAELILLAEGANSHRPVLDGYTIPFLDQLIVIVSAATIMAYSLYTFSATNLPANHLMMLTIPFVLYGIFRYLHLVHVEDAGGAPDELILSDRALLITLLLWGALSILILYLGQ